MEQRITVFNRDSTLFAFCNFVRKFYTGKGIPEQTNRCMIFQSTFWGLLFIVCSIIPMTLGWICAKVGMNITSADNRFSLFLTNYLKLDKIYEESPEIFQKSPVLAGWIYLIVTLGTILVPFVIIALFLCIGYNFVEIVLILWSQLLWVGWGIFVGMAAIGEQEANAVNILWSAISWFLWSVILNLEFWKTIGYWMLSGFLVIFGTLAASSVITLGCMKLLNTELGEGLKKLLANRYKERLEIRKLTVKERQAERLRREQELVAKLRARPAWTCNRCEQYNLGSENWCLQCVKRRPDYTNLYHIIITNSLTAIKYRLGLVRDVEIGNKVIVKFTFIRGFLSYLWDLKKGSCPIVLAMNQSEINELYKRSQSRVPTVVEILLYKGLATQNQIQTAQLREKIDSHPSHDTLWYLRYLWELEDEVNLAETIRDYLIAQRTEA